jgi:hypothetical protein
MEQHLQQHRPVCLGTRALVGRSDRTLGSSGETKSKGLAGSHGYAVTGCFKVPDSPLRFVQVYNPWGNTGQGSGRGYTFSPEHLKVPPSRAARERAEKRKAGGLRPETAYETDEPLFWVELTDLTRRFDLLYTCTKTPDLIVEGRRLGL